MKVKTDLLDIPSSFSNQTKSSFRNILLADINDYFQRKPTYTPTSAQRLVFVKLKDSSTKTKKTTKKK